MMQTLIILEINYTRRRIVLFFFYIGLNKLMQSRLLEMTIKSGLHNGIIGSIVLYKNIFWIAENH